MDPISALRLSASAALQPGMQAQPTALTKGPTASELQGLSLDNLDSSLPTPASSGFDGVLQNMVTQVNEKQAVAGQAVTGLLSGQEVPLHQAVLAMEEASVSFQLMVEVRNKLLESYQELMRMQV